ncbi:hypothetical protein KAFR_0B06000 [Kazachstania africana CBS 2517]|uniref:SHSP domain-containing protein n=1 Tax=Kazachstania africana (strain ATCC 22294 / BCRC 22015 / CBS 2517 / CECT 1963 / NBRC 1671 / NRRL Y-8276) TaxID=1071382 RepID=H2AR96_KAZAF|nr:hypothetical protein KAFR_0B06000 [Kazachstania africana CBS 2517]CCF56896.1 hypothetical protein KAFR_0B06000 [Kazachstania africana CBS 2517]
MSFYQPSLSLYDVLNALSNQTRLRDPYENVRARRPHHVHRSHTPGRVHYHNPFGVPASYFYRMPEQGYYYSPQYEYDDEDEDEDQRMGGAEETTSSTSERQEPSYYHGNGERAERKQERDPLSELLNAFVGKPPFTVGEEEEEEGEEEEEKKEDKQLEEEKSKETPGAEIQKGIKKSTKKEPTHNVTTTKEAEAVTDIKQPVAEYPPKLKRKSSSFAHLKGPSPVPDPLQVSKPETRLDLPFSPEVNIYDTPDRYSVALALPGANSKAFKIDYHPSSHELLVKGNILDRIGIDESYLKITELKYGAFERTVKFPSLPRIKDDEIKATYSNGLLQIQVPKEREDPSNRAPKKRIAIEDVPDEELEFEQNPNPVQKI